MHPRAPSFPDTPKPAENSNQMIAVHCAWDDMTHDRSIELLERVLADAIRSDARVVLLDVAGVQNADSKLIACLIVVQAMARRRGSTLVIRTSVCVENWICVCRVGAVIDHRPEDPLRVC